MLLFMKCFMVIFLRLKIMPRRLKSFQEWENFLDDCLLMSGDVLIIPLKNFYGTSQIQITRLPWLISVSSPKMFPWFSPDNKVTLIHKPQKTFYNPNRKKKDSLGFYLDAGLSETYSKEVIKSP